MEEVVSKTKKVYLGAAIIGILNVVGLLAVVILIVILPIINGSNKAEYVAEEEEVSVPLAGEEVPVIEFSDIVADWVARLPAGAEASVVIYDLDNDEELVAQRAEVSRRLASVYKLLVVYEGYLRVADGAWDPAAYLTGGHTVLECLDLAVRESNSACAESLWAEIGRYSLDQILESYGVTSRISSLSATARDISAMLQVIYRHEYLGEELYARLLDSMLVQPATASELCEGLCNWRAGLPAGFSEAQSYVFNKVGWDAEDGKWTLYNDVALVEVEDGSGTLHHYAVVVLTTNTGSWKLAELGRLIEGRVVDFGGSV